MLADPVRRHSHQHSPLTLVRTSWDVQDSSVGGARLGELGRHALSPGCGIAGMAMPSQTRALHAFPIDIRLRVREAGSD